MFKNDYQGGPFFEIFTPQTKDSVANWKLSSSVKKAYEKEVKSYVYSLEGSTATTKMQLPKDLKSSLTLIQRYLNFQIMVPKGQDFSIELGVTDLGNNKRRLLLSTSQKETQVTPLHAKVPLAIMKRGTWLNLCLDMVSMVGETWRNQTYKAIESITVSANCRLRKIFTMKSQPPDNSGDDELFGCGCCNSGELEHIPKQCQFASDVHHITQLFTMNKVRHAERLKGGDGTCPASALEIDLNASGRKSSFNDSFHIAFGYKIPGAPTQNTSRRSIREGNVTNRTVGDASSRADDRYGSTNKDLSSSIISSDGFSFSRNAVSAPSHHHIRTKVEPSLSVPNHADNLESTRIDSEDVPVVQPHPPRVPSSDRLRRRIRVKNGSSSAGKERVNSAGSSKDGDNAGSQLNLNVSSADKNVQRKRVLSDGDILDMDSGISSDVSVNRHRSAEQSHRVPPVGNKWHEDIRVGQGVPEIHIPKKEYDRDQYQGEGEASDDQDDSMSNVLEVLKQGIDLKSAIPSLQQEEGDESSESDGGLESDSLSRPGEYEESEDEESSGKDVYLFVSPPKSAPRRNISPNQHEDLQVSNKVLNRGYRKNLMDSNSARGAKPEDDFVNSDLSSSDEEDPRKKKGSNSRPTSGTSSAGASPKVMRSVHRNSPNSNKENSPSRARHLAPKYGKSPENEMQKTFKPGSNLSPSFMGAGGTSSMSRIDRKSLREIPDPKIKSSERPYDFTKYQLEDVSESFEARMLASMQRHQDDDYEEATESPAKVRSFSNRSPRHIDNISRHLYDSSPTTTSDDDTSFGTLKAPALNPHNYQEEMKARLSSDTLTSSNPRDWSGVYSPPIVLPSEMAQGADSPTKLSPRKAYTGLNGHLGNINSSTQISQEEELDLRYDPCLNCYYDPKTCKYYELI